MESNIVKIREAYNTIRELEKQKGMILFDTQSKNYQQLKVMISKYENQLQVLDMINQQLDKKINSKFLELETKLDYLLNGRKVPRQQPEIVREVAERVKEIKTWKLEKADNVTRHICNNGHQIKVITSPDGSQIYKIDENTPERYSPTMLPSLKERVEEMEELKELEVVTDET